MSLKEKKKKENRYHPRTVPIAQLVAEGIELTPGYFGETDSIVCVVSRDEQNLSTSSHRHISGDFS